jgi:iron-sulfur cluster repair protein YtfE (RIC family)
MARAHSGEERNVIDLLVEDHKRVQKLFKDFEKADRADTEGLHEIVETTCMELQIHSMLEEELFYPAIREELASDETDERLNRAEVEHEAADELIAKLQELSPDDTMYCAYFAVLGEYVRHHIREEEKELFPLASAAGLDLQQLAADMRQRRDELFAELESAEGEDDADADGDDDAEDDAEDAIETGDLAESATDDEELEDEPGALDPRRTRH